MNRASSAGVSTSAEDALSRGDLRHALSDQGNWLCVVMLAVATIVRMPATHAETIRKTLSRRRHRVPCGASPVGFSMHFVIDQPGRWTGNLAPFSMAMAWATRYGFAPLGPRCRT